MGDTSSERSIELGDTTTLLLLKDVITAVAADDGGDGFTPLVRLGVVATVVSGTLEFDFGL